LKTIEDATTIRRIAAFEHAERATDETERAKFLTFVVIAVTPTGVELAGTIAELARDTLRSDFRNFDTRKARVVLVEAGPRILPGLRESLSAYAREALTNLGVDVTLGRLVTECTANGVEIDGRYLPAKTILWAAGVAASPAADWLHAPADRAGRILVQPDLTVPGHPNIFAIGDTAMSRCRTES
jgi:NADH:ubiquinone reductase (H+-translocating)